MLILECQWADSLHLWPTCRYHQYYQTPGEELLTPTYVRALVDFLVSLMVVGGLDEVSDQILEAIPDTKKIREKPCDLQSSSNHF